MLGPTHPHRGKPLSAETRAKMSASHLARGTIPPRPTPESIAKSAASRLGIHIHAGRLDEQHAILASARAPRKKQFTSPEMALARLLDQAKLPYKQQRGIKGVFHLWDFMLEVGRILIEVDGCYWHGCEACGFGHRKHSKDARLTWRANELGWRVIRIWEHELKRPEELLAKLTSQLNRDLEAVA
jgi:G:T-mismatch repair DNA endonuclease (very short patch repair protein)